MDYQKIGNFINLLRKEKGITQKELSLSSNYKDLLIILKEI